MENIKKWCVDNKNIDYDIFWYGFGRYDFIVGIL